MSISEDIRKTVRLAIQGQLLKLEPPAAFWFECCNCGNTHVLLCSVDKDGNIEIRVFLDEYETGLARKKGGKSRKKQ
jgi:hypothetical protein